MDKQTTELKSQTPKKASGNFIKWVRSLSLKKNRDDQGCFVAEGMKLVVDTLAYFECIALVATKEWFESVQEPVKSYMVAPVVASREQMQRMSQFSTPSDVLAVYKIPQRNVSGGEIRSNLNIVLDGVQDPGNLGTIVRVADWFGISDVFCSESTADIYSHKAIQATMGAISRVRVHYCELCDLLSRHSDLPIYGTFLNGENIYNAELSEKGFIVFGSEGHGISDRVSKIINRRLLIPSYPSGADTSESLNVSVAAAITVNEFRRRLSSNLQVH